MERGKPVKTSLFFYVPLSIAGILLVVYVFMYNYKKGEEAGLNAPPPAEGTRTAKAEVNHRALAKDTGLAGDGKMLFQLNCASCHGTEGRGDGDRSASLNPAPRNYHEETFKFGSDIVSIHNTILRGSPGTSMPSFALLPAKDVWALAHFVLTQVPNAPAITDSLLAQLPEGEGASAEDTKAAAIPGMPDSLLQPAGPRIPIQFAMERIAHAMADVKLASLPSASHPGASIYAHRCASCHGANGEGAKVRVVSVAPYRYANTSSLLNEKAAWFNNRNEFGRIVMKGLPGRLMPGNATLTKQQMDDLFAYVRSFSQSR